jgi:hypothetical protein
MYGGGLDSNTTGRRNDGTQPISVMPLHIMGMKHWGEDDE